MSLKISRIAIAARLAISEHGRTTKIADLEDSGRLQPGLAVDLAVERFVDADANPAGSHSDLESEEGEDGSHPGADCHSYRMREEHDLDEAVTVVPRVCEPVPTPVTLDVE